MGAWLPSAASDWCRKVLRLKVQPRRAASCAHCGQTSGGSTMPRFTVHIRDEWLAVPCRDTTNTIRWLGLEALKRYVKNKPDNGGITAVKDTRFAVRRCQGLGLLDADDTIDDVLEDNDFVELGMTACTTNTGAHLESCVIFA